MTPSFSAKELSRALRADVPPVEDDLYAVRLAQVARTAPAQPAGHRMPRGLKVGIATASVVVTVFGAAHASSLLLAPSEPAITPPSDHGLEDPVDPLPETDTPRRRSQQRSDQERDISAPDREPPGSELPSLTEDKAEGPDPDDGTQPTPPSVPDPPSVSDDQEHDTDDTDDTDGPEVEVDERDRPAADSEPVDDFEGDD